MVGNEKEFNFYYEWGNTVTDFYDVEVIASGTKEDIQILLGDVKKYNRDNSSFPILSVMQTESYGLMTHTMTCRHHTLIWMLCAFKNHDIDIIFNVNRYNNNYDYSSPKIIFVGATTTKMLFIEQSDRNEVNDVVIILRKYVSKYQHMLPKNELRTFTHMGTENYCAYVVNDEIIDLLTLGDVEFIKTNNISFDGKTQYLMYNGVEKHVSEILKDGLIDGGIDDFIA